MKTDRGTFTQAWSLTTVGDWNRVTTDGTAQTRTHGLTHELLAGGSNVSAAVVFFQDGKITIADSLRGGAATSRYVFGS